MKHTERTSRRVETTNTHYMVPLPFEIAAVAIEMAHEQKLPLAEVVWVAVGIMAEVTGIHLRTQHLPKYEDG